MKHLFAVLLLLAAGFTASAQTGNDAEADSIAYTVNLKEVKVTARWKNDTDRYRYNQTKHYVTMVLPYVNAATQLFNDINSKASEPGISNKERRRYINDREDEMRTQFEDKIKALNNTQGVLLVKLIARQTGTRIYQTLQEFKNPLTAVKWQTWARMHGMNLDKRYDPEEEPQLELIMEELGYPLSASYTLQNNKG